MKKRQQVLAICGSTRKNSSNHRLIKAIAGLSAENLELVFFEGLAELPQFNPDEDNENTDKRVLDLRNQLRNADGIIICTPEYAHGVPGALKNAIDWTVSSGEFSHKPTMLITASTDGQFGHKALLETLRVIEAKDIDRLQLLISFVQTKINAQHTITDEKTLIEIKQLIADFIKAINN